MDAQRSSEPTPNWVRPVGVLAVVVAVIALLKGIRMPNLWGATHYAFNYSQGFIRRGLFGEILRRTLGARALHYSTLVAVACFWFVAVLGLLSCLVFRVLHRSPQDMGFWAAVFVLAASPGLVFMIHLIGYLDYVGIACELGVILFVLDSQRRRSALVPVIIGLSMLLPFIHESSVVFFTPVFFFMILCDQAAHAPASPASPRSPTGSRWFKPYVPLVLVAASAVLSSVVIGQLGTRSHEFADQLRLHLQPSADFPLRVDAFETLFQSVVGSVREVMPHYWRQPENRAVLLRGLTVTIPGLSYLLILGVRLIRTAALPSRPRSLLVVSFLAAALAPLVMNFVAWDTERWNALSTLSAFICICVFKRIVSPAVDPGAHSQAVTSPWLLSLAAGAVAVGLCTSFPTFLYDDYKVHWFPFDDRGAELLDLFTRTTRFVPRY